MKIDLKLSYDQISAVSILTHQVYDLKPTINVSENKIRCIAYNIADKFMNKRKSIIKSGNLVKKKNGFKMTLKFNEAEVLHQIIVDMINTVNDTYYRTILDKLKNEIDSKII